VATGKADRPGDVDESRRLIGMTSAFMLAKLVCEGFRYTGLTVGLQPPITSSTAVKPSVVISSREVAG
jgi:hypothetical protein